MLRRLKQGITWYSSKNYLIDLVYCQNYPNLRAVDHNQIIIVYEGYAF